MLWCKMSLLVLWWCFMLVLWGGLCLHWGGIVQFQSLIQPYTRYCMEQKQCVEYTKSRHNDNDLFKIFVMVSAASFQVSIQLVGSGDRVQCAVSPLFLVLFTTLMQRLVAVGGFSYTCALQYEHHTTQHTGVHHYHWLAFNIGCL